MIALIERHVLSDGSEVFDVEIEESGITMVSIPCYSQLAAACLLKSLNENTLVQVKWNG